MRSGVHIRTGSQSIQLINDVALVLGPCNVKPFRGQHPGYSMLLEMGLMCESRY